MQLFSCASMVGLALAVGACGAAPKESDPPPQSEPPSVGTASVAVSITYRERMAVPEGSVVEAELLDVTGRGAAPVILSRERIRTLGQPPYRITLPYPPSAIDPSGLYVVRARILVNGLARFTSDMEHPVITRGGAQDVVVVLRAAR